MTEREGNLEAPTRHPLDWLAESFHDPAALSDELHRVFEICHGCRRCVSLCGAFPTLFDLIDATSDGELGGVERASYSKVVDQCYLCDLCYMTKCPYVPPHPWNVDFPHLMLRAKAVKFRAGDVKLRDRILSNTDMLGTFAGIPIVTQVVNATNRTKTARAAMEHVLGVDRRAWLPPFAKKRFDAGELPSESLAVRPGARTPGKLAVFATCYVRYNEPGIGYDLLELLRHNEVPYVMVEDEGCCGMPLLEQGDLEGVARKKAANIGKLAQLANAGYGIVTPIPSCTLMYKQELPLMFPNDDDVRTVRDAMWDPFEYFVARHRDGLLKTDFKNPLGQVSYHIPCHSRVQNVGRKTAEALQLVPGTTLNVVERCSGHAGTFGVKREFHAVAMKIGRPVFRAMSEPQPDVIASDCQLAGRHIEQGMAEAGFQSVPLLHPLALLCRAYGLALPLRDPADVTA